MEHGVLQIVDDAIQNNISTYTGCCNPYNELHKTYNFNKKAMGEKLRFSLQQMQFL